MRRIQVLILAAFTALSGACAPSRQQEGAPAGGAAPAELTVFAAASLSEAFKTIGDDFGKANGGVKVTFNFGGSQQLAQQLAQGAPADVFASANQKQMDAVVEAGRIDKDTARTFARNRLVVVVPMDNPGRVMTLEDLAKPGLKIILAAKEVPVGQYALDMLDKAEKEGGAHAGFKAAVLENVVSYEQDVKAVLTKVALAEADAGVVYASDISQEARDRVVRVDVPEAVNVIASYPIAIVKDSKHAELAKRFVDHVRSPAGQTVLVNYGFISTTRDATSAAPATAPVEVTGLVTTEVCEMGGM